MYRHIDRIGRIVIPKEIRDMTGIDIKDDVKIYLEDDHIVIKKAKEQNRCMITGEVSRDNLILSDGKVVLSKKAAQELMRILEDNS